MFQSSEPVLQDSAHVQNIPNFIEEILAFYHEIKEVYIKNWVGLSLVILRC
jgi:hypothetical protein